MKGSDSEKITKAYDRVAQKNPEIINQRHLELLTRVYIMRQKRLVSGLFFIIGALLFTAAVLAPTELKESSSVVGLLISLSILVGIVFVVIGVCKFAKAMPAPLTTDEAQELAHLNAAQKGLVTDTGASKYNSLPFIQRQQEKYDAASPLKKLLILFARIPTLLEVFFVIMIAIGTFYTVSGAYNVLTYEERNKNAVEVEAVIVDIRDWYDSDAEETEYKYTYEYSYNGKTYTTTEITYTTYHIGRSKTILIDSTNPKNVIKNGGRSNLTIGVIVLAAGWVMLICSMLKVRDLEAHFSVFNLFWLMFAAAAVSFAVWGISLLIKAETVAGLFVLLLGCPIWLVGMFMFRKLADDV